MAKELDDDPSEDDVQATDVGDDEQNKDEDDEEVLSQLVATRPLDLAQLSNRLLSEGHRANALLACARACRGGLVCQQNPSCAPAGKNELTQRPPPLLRAGRGRQ